MNLPLVSVPSIWCLGELCNKRGLVRPCSGMLYWSIFVRSFALSRSTQHFNGVPWKSFFPSFISLVFPCFSCREHRLAWSPLYTFLSPSPLYLLFA
ncbi:hypothetical protein VTP01DRAFT_1002 [Rhizomucor pusillus]|uniref:uncharacterized protein n=1 Tax=Rhizomucor pusillus TaxID=4840 RepID=UPI0037441986